MATTRQQYEHEYGKKDKSGRRKFVAFFIAFLLTFCVGVWVGYNYYPDIRKLAGRTVRAPLEGVKSVLEGAASFASKEELLGAVESNKDLRPNEKESLMQRIKEAYKVKEEYDGQYKASVEQLWDQARKLYEEAREDGEVTASELRVVVAKLGEATDTAR